MSYAFDAPYDCALCPRLRAFIDEKKQDLPSYFNGPVPRNMAFLTINMISAAMMGLSFTGP